MTAIEFENVSKQYRLGLVSTGTIAHDLNRFWQMKVMRREDPYLKIGETNDRSTKGLSKYVWALKDINFKIEEGDVVGIIGRNGAGKSTLLKLLSRVTSPTTGEIRVRGRIASLLEVGTGFHPEMTGRENIYMNGVILGMTRAEITRKLDEIVDFSGCERYIDTPVKRYSSGMSVRLGFAIAAHLDPEILVVDEVLAVGDAEFQKKAIGKMQEVAHGQGRTVLFVSHNMRSLRALCKSGVVLENGTVGFMGTAEEAVNYYLKDFDESSQGGSLVDAPRAYKYDGRLRFIGIQIHGNDSEDAAVCCGGVLRVEVKFEVTEHLENCVLSMGLHESLGNPLMAFPSDLLAEGLTLEKGVHTAILTIPRLPLSRGEYVLSLFSCVFGRILDFIECAVRLKVADGDYIGKGRMTGPHLLRKIVLCDHGWNVDGKDL